LLLELTPVNFSRTPIKLDLAPLISHLKDLVIAIDRRFYALKTEYHTPPIFIHLIPGCELANRRISSQVCIISGQCFYLWVRTIRLINVTV
jgi:hypothetical protein